MHRMTLIAAILVALGATAHSGESLSPETLLPSHENKDAYWPGTAFGKDVFLVTWQSGRLAEGDLRDGPKFVADIVGCRVDKTGKALDAQPFIICRAPDVQERPKVAFDGKVFLVVWQDLRNVKDWDVYAARVTPEGKVLDPDGFLVAGAPRSQCMPRVAWDGKTFLVVWQDLRSNDFYEVYAARVSSDGKVLDPQGIRVAAIPGRHRNAPAVASMGGGKSFILWNSNAYGRHLGGMMSGWTLLAEGAVGKTEMWGANTPDWRNLPYGGCVPMCVAAGPNAYLAAWTTQIPGGRSNGSPDGNAAVLDAEGKLLSYKVTLAGKPHNIIAPDAAWDGSGFVAAWAEQVNPQGKFPHDTLKVTRLSAEGKPSGVVLEVSGTPESPAKSAAVASDGAGTTLVAYEKHPDKAEVPIKIGFRLLTAK